MRYPELEASDAGGLAYAGLVRLALFDGVAARRFGRLIETYTFPFTVRIDGDQSACVTPDASIGSVGILDFR